MYSNCLIATVWQPKSCVKCYQRQANCWWTYGTNWSSARSWLRDHRSSHRSSERRMRRASRGDSCTRTADLPGSSSRLRRCSSTSRRARDFGWLGGGLTAQGLTVRPPQDPDFFTRPGGGDVGLARDHFLAAAGDRGWTVGWVQDSETFRRLLVHGPEKLVVDVALDSAPGRPASVSIASPIDESTGRKMIALFRLRRRARLR
jgi:hypothetical protein